MDYNTFLPTCKKLVADYVNNQLVKLSNETIDSEEVYVVWHCKTLQNAKALLSTNLPDGMYYEITYNGDKAEYYFDAYMKTDNIKIETKEGEILQ